MKIISPQNREAGPKAYTLYQLSNRQGDFCVPDFFVVKFENDGEVTDEAILADIVRRADALGCATFAVRSSASCEDGATFSFAGLFDSVICVSKEELPAALKKVHFSKNNARAVKYMEHFGINRERMDMCIIVQCFIEAQISGTCFTSTGDMGEVYIEYVTGASGVVGGNDAPCALSLRAHDHVDALPETVREPVKHLLSACPEVQDILHCRRADIEWAYCDGRLYLLQARPAH